MNEYLNGFRTHLGQLATMVPFMMRDVGSELPQAARETEEVNIGPARVGLRLVLGTRRPDQ